jgi:hypothetical protein
MRQATNRKEIYRFATCCHSIAEASIPAAPSFAGCRLDGADEGTLASSHPVKTVGSFWLYATTVFDYVRRAVPY